MLVPSFLLWAQCSGQCQQPRLLLGWLVSLGQGSAAAQYWHLCVSSVCSCGPFWELGEATGAALGSLWPGWCWEHQHCAELDQVGPWGIGGTSTADSGAPGLSLSLWVVRGQAWCLQLLGGFMGHFCWRLAPHS